MSSRNDLFHELFATDWADDDQEYADEIQHYAAALEQLLALDANLTNFIKTQPILDNDQLSSIPIVSDVGKSVVVFETDARESNLGYMVQIYSTNVPLNILFSNIAITTSTTTHTYNPGSNQADYIQANIGNPTDPNIVISCTWNSKLCKLPPPLEKFMGTPVAIPGNVALKILSHIDNKHLNNGSVIKCDMVLKNIFGVDEIRMDSIGSMINSITSPLEPLIMNMTLPQSRSAVNIHYPILSSESAAPFQPIKVEPAPIDALLEAAVKSKEQICAANAFLRNPKEFVDNESLNAARLVDIPELYTSHYIFDQQWTVDAATDFLKIAASVNNERKNAAKTFPHRP